MQEAHQNKRGGGVKTKKRLGIFEIESALFKSLQRGAVIVIFLSFGMNQQMELKDTIYF